MGYWVDLPTAYLTLHQRLRRVAVVDPEAVLGSRADLPGLQGRALLPALRHAAQQPRAGAGIPGRHEGPQRLRQVPAARSARASTCWSGRPRRGRCRATSRWRWARTSTTCCGEHGDDKLWLAEALLGKVFEQPRRATVTSAAARPRAASCWAGTTAALHLPARHRRTTATSSPATSSAPRTARAWCTSRRRSAPTTWRWAGSSTCPR